MKIANCKPVMTAKLILNLHNGRQRVYKLSHDISVGTNGPIKPSIEDARRRWKEEYRHLIPENVDTWDLVCISDAHTHIERLAFLGIALDDKRGGPLICDTIAGENTWMIHGGDPEAVYPDDKYLKELAELNNFEWGGIVDENS